MVNLERSIVPCVEGKEKKNVGFYLFLFWLLTCLADDAPNVVQVVLLHLVTDEQGQFFVIECSHAYKNFFLLHKSVFLRNVRWIPCSSHDIAR